MTVVDVTPVETDAVATGGDDVAAAGDAGATDANCAGDGGDVGDGVVAVDPEQPAATKSIRNRIWRPRDD